MARDSGPPQLKKIVAPTAGIMPDVVFVSTQIDSVFDAWYAAFDLVCGFIFISEKKKDRK